jgi:hypothetical protein
MTIRQSAAGRNRSYVKTKEVISAGGTGPNTFTGCNPAALVYEEGHHPS